MIAGVQKYILYATNGRICITGVTVLESLGMFASSMSISKFRHSVPQRTSIIITFKLSIFLYKLLCNHSHIVATVFIVRF